MKKYIRTLSLLLTAVLTISITGCGSSDADGAKDRKGLMAAKELSGVWTDESGNILRLDTVENTYTYLTARASPRAEKYRTSRSKSLAECGRTAKGKHW